MMVNAEPGEESLSMALLIEENEFAKNGGEYSVMLAMHESNTTNGSFERNRLHDNVNSVASVVLTSPNYRLESNDFHNPLSAHEVDVRSDGSWKLQATGNSWGTHDMKKALKAPEGSLPVEVVHNAAARPAMLPIIPQLLDKSQCAHLNYCSHVGKCE
ncbi:hypothetical protein NECAME_09049, partial [Necator americanus]